jgi:hypothetical protein
MKTLWTSLTKKHGSWWVGAILGDIKYSFVCHPDYAHLPKSVRRQAASRAVSSSFRFLSFWIALASMIGLVVGLCIVDGFFHVSDANGTLGAVLGFLIGEVLLVKAIYEAGLQTYKAGLPEINKDAEQGGGGNSAALRASP